MATNGFESIKAQVAALDDAVYQAICRTHSPAVDATMPRLTNLADHSKLWGAIAVGMQLSGRPRLRRAAGRGLVSLAVTSVVTNQGLKRSQWRNRPALHVLPDARRSRRTPSSSSFPSGHAASAAAFATGVALESPAAGLAVGALATAVGFSRVATGAHYPSDVLVGFGVGAAVALLGSQLVPTYGPPPVVPCEPVEVDLGERPNGEGVVLVVNEKSGLFDRRRMVAAVHDALPAAEILECRPGDDLVAMLQDAASRAQILAVAGGDGSVAAGASAALAADVPLAVFAGGTFNHFAKAMEIAHPTATIRAIRLGTATKVDVAYLNDQLFLNTASTGVYADFVRIRERYQRALSKPAAMVLAAARVVRQESSIRLRWNGIERDVALFFAGNSRYEPSGFAPSARPRLDDGLLDIRILEYTRGWKRAKVLASLATGRLARNANYHEYAAPRMSFEAVDQPVAVTRDGELGERITTLDFGVDYQALTVLAPARRRH